MLCQGSQMPFPREPALYLLWPCPPGSPGLSVTPQSVCHSWWHCWECQGAGGGEPAEAAGGTWPLLSLMCNNCTGVPCHPQAQPVVFPRQESPPASARGGGRVVWVAARQAQCSVSLSCLHLQPMFSVTPSLATNASAAFNPYLGPVSPGLVPAEILPTAPMLVTGNPGVPVPAAAAAAAQKLMRTDRLEVGAAWCNLLSQVLAFIVSSGQEILAL